MADVLEVAMLLATLENPTPLHSRERRRRINNYYLGDPTGFAINGYADIGNTQSWSTDGVLAWGSPLSLYALSSTITVVPEPSSLVMAALGLSGLAGLGWRRRKGR